MTQLEIGCDMAFHQNDASRITAINVIKKLLKLDNNNYVICIFTIMHNYYT